MYSAEIENRATELYDELMETNDNMNHKGGSKFHTIDFYEINNYFEMCGTEIKEIICKHIQKLTQEIG